MERLSLGDKIKIGIGAATLLVGGYGIGRSQSLRGGEEPAGTQRPKATESMPTVAGTASSACKDGKFFTTAFIAGFGSQEDCQDFEDKVRAGRENRLPSGIPTNNGFGGSPRVDGLNK